MHTMNTQMGRYTTSDLDKLEVPKKDPSPQWKHQVNHECVSEKPTIHNKKMKASIVKVDKINLK